MSNSIIGNAMETNIQQEMTGGQIFNMIFILIVLIGGAVKFIIDSRKMEKPDNHKWQEYVFFSNIQIGILCLIGVSMGCIMIPLDPRVEIQLVSIPWVLLFILCYKYTYIQLRLTFIRLHLG